MKPRLHGKVALITGASAGIGQACARALGAEGAHLVLTARRGERLDTLRKEIEKDGQRVVHVLGDAREEETAIKTVKAATDAFGTVDILINNTGVGNYKNLVDTSVEDYDEMMDTNVRSTFLFTRHAVPVMIEKKQGTIVMISSMAGIYGFPGEAVYSGRFCPSAGQGTASPWDQGRSNLSGRGQDRICLGERPHGGEGRGVRHA